MNNFFKQLRMRNPILYYFGWMNLVAAIVSTGMIGLTDAQVLGINAWIKPMKFFISIAVFSWTMGWLMFYLQKQRRVKAYSIMVVIVLTFEMVVIVWQAANGRLSHFNISTPLYGILFSLMGVAITVLGVWTGYICYLFFRQKEFNIPQAYLWGIRLGLLFFVIFSFEGGLMASRLSHTVGAPDGSAGMPVVNWSTQYGDLRVAHFIGMHALQVLPLAGYYVFRKPTSMLIFSALYLALTIIIMVRALSGLPLI